MWRNFFSHASIHAFEFEDENMMSGSGLVHTLPFEIGLEYYIKCKDIYETMGACLVVTGGY